MKIAYFFSAVFLLTGCTVGPDYRGPPAVTSDPEVPVGFVRARDAALTSSPGVARWWEELRDPTLTALIDQALVGSPTIDRAEARIREAAAQVSSKHAGVFPNVNGNSSYLRADIPTNALGGGGGAPGGRTTGLGFYDLGLNASWEPDLFGGQRRGLEQARATLGQRFAELADVQVSLSADVAQAYVALRAAQEQVQLNARSVEIERQALNIALQRSAAGTGSAIQTARLETQLQITEAQKASFVTRVDEALDQLATLTGHRPGALDLMLASKAPVPLPPAQVRIGDPATVIAHRPDIRAAERALAASTAEIGIVKAQHLPGLRYFGVLGIGGTNFGSVVDPTNLTTLLAPVLNWALLDFGRSRAAVRQSNARADEAAAQYREVVLDALQDAETSLARFGNTRIELAERLRAQTSAQYAVELSSKRVAAGTSTVGDQLDIEYQRVSAAAAVADSRAQLTRDFIAVQKALGLGWTDSTSSASDVSSGTRLEQ